MNDFPTPQPTDLVDDATELPALTRTERHRLLAAERRRVALRVLDEHSLPTGLDELADAVRDRETGTDSPRPATAESVRITLHHKHLPLMADLGLVDYDPDTHCVRAP
jgi:hypothetical protein